MTTFLATTPTARTTISAPSWYIARQHARTLLGADVVVEAYEGEAEHVAPPMPTATEIAYEHGRSLERAAYRRAAEHIMGLAEASTQRRVAEALRRAADDIEAMGEES